MHAPRQSGHSLVLFKWSTITAASRAATVNSSVCVPVNDTNSRSVYDELEVVGNARIHSIDQTYPNRRVEQGVGVREHGYVVYERFLQITVLFCL